MNYRETIRKIIAFVLLLVALFSAMPKQYLHDLVADHTDCVATAASGHETSVNQAGPDCHCQDLVVSTPFVQSLFTADFTLPVHCSHFISSSHRQANLITQYTKDLRGPPVAA